MKREHCYIAIDLKSFYASQECVDRGLDPMRTNLVVADENTFSAAGEKTLKALTDKDVVKVIFSGNEILVPNEEAIETVRSHLEGRELIVGIGSGVVQDLCKFVSFYNKIPYMIVATAPSMDGYASN